MSRNCDDIIYILRRREEEEAFTFPILSEKLSYGTFTSFTHTNCRSCSVPYVLQGIDRIQPYAIVAIHLAELLCLIFHLRSRLDGMMRDC